MSYRSAKRSTPYRLMLPMLPKFPRGVLLRSSLNNFHEPSAQASRILSRVRDAFLKLQMKGIYISQTKNCNKYSVVSSVLFLHMRYYIVTNHSHFEPAQVASKTVPVLKSLIIYQFIWFYIPIFLCHQSNERGLTLWSVTTHIVVVPHC